MGFFLQLILPDEGLPSCLDSSQRQHLGTVG